MLLLEPPMPHWMELWEVQSLLGCTTALHPSLKTPDSPAPVTAKNPENRGVESAKIGYGGRLTRPIER